MQHFPLTEKLHTDVLEEKYGPISAKVLKHTDHIREALLVDSKGISRTYALTFIEPFENVEIQKINVAIKKGLPIGKAFRSEGYTIRKNVLDVFITQIPSWLKKEFRTAESRAKARLSEFYAKKVGKAPVIYGIVTEVYTPDFRKPVINDVDTLQIGAVTSCLEKNGFSKEEIYRRIGDDNNYDDASSRYLKAKKISAKIISELREKIIEEMKYSE